MLGVVLLNAAVIHSPAASAPLGTTVGKDTVFISDAEVGALTSWQAAIEALRDAYAGHVTDAMVPPRVMARGNGFWLRGLCAVSPSGDYMGCKLIAASPKTHRASYLISLFDQRTMELAALIDGNRITDIRTAATAIVAVDKLANPGALKVAVIGSSSLARNSLAALAAIREISEVKVFSPTPASREKFAADFVASHQLNVTAVAAPADAVKGANVVLCAARSKDESPVFLGEWLEAGQVIISVGSTLPEQREVDSEALKRATLIVCDMKHEIVEQTGDALAAIKDGIDVAAKSVDLSEVMSGKVAGRNSADDILIYKSVGTALQDVVTAEMLLRRAREQQRGRAFGDGIVTIDR